MKITQAIRKRVNEINALIEQAIAKDLTLHSDFGSTVIDSFELKPIKINKNSVSIVMYLYYSSKGFRSFAYYDLDDLRWELKHIRRALKSALQ
jgi:hypothetical protein